MGATHCNTECGDQCERHANESSVEIWAESRPPGASQGLGCNMDTREPFTVELFTGDAQKGQLGMSISADDDPSYVTITDVWHIGLVAAWNEDNHLQKQVRAGDVIVSAGGVVGDSFLIMDAIVNEELWDNVDVLVLLICPEQKLDKWLGSTPREFYNLPNYKSPPEFYNLLQDTDEEAEVVPDLASMLPPDRVVDLYTDFAPYLPYAEEYHADDPLVISNSHRLWPRDHHEEDPSDEDP